MPDPLTINLNMDILKAAESSLMVHSLDDLFEVYLSHLLLSGPIKKVEVLLFDRQMNLIPVAEGKKIGPKDRPKLEFRIQSWILDSYVKHSSRNRSLSYVHPVFAIPLLETGGLLGFMYIHFNRFQIPDNDLMGTFQLAGLNLAAKIKEIKLNQEIAVLKSEQQDMISNNRKMARQVTSFSKELFAISAISTRINQSMDFDKSIRKSMTVIRDVFKAPGIVIYVKNTGTSKMELSAVDFKDDAVDAHLFEKYLKKIEPALIGDVLGSDRPIVKDLRSEFDTTMVKNMWESKFKKVIGLPLTARNIITGVMFLFHPSSEPFNQAGIRLLSGMANIMSMGIENMNLFRQNEQKKDEAEFLVASITRFHEKLDLTETLKSVAEQGAKFIGPQCNVFLFSETKVPLVQATHVNREGKNYIKTRIYKKIKSKEIENVYGMLISENQSVLIQDIGEYNWFGHDLKPYFMMLGIHSLVAVPLRVRKKKRGLLLFALGCESRSFDSHDLSFAEALGGAASLALENARAHTDSLEMSEFLEKKITKKTDQIQEIQARQKIRVENRKDLIFRVNRENRFVFVNRAMEILTGCTRESLYRGDLQAMDAVGMEDRERITIHFRDVLSGKLPMVKDLEYRHLNRKGEDHFISLTIYPETGASGRIVGIEGVGRDITEKKRLEAELEKTKDLALLGEFSGAVAHQVRNPLGNILMGVKLLQKMLGMNVRAEAEGDAPHDGYVNVKPSIQSLSTVFGDLTEGIQNLNQVVTKLLEYTKTLKLSRSSQKIDVILSETVSAYQEMLSQSGIEVVEAYDPDLPLLRMDAILMGQVFQIIIHNAIQSMPTGGRISLITGFYPRKSGEACITIKDLGTGIPLSEIEKVFRPFYTTKTDGAGLGLSLAYRIVEAHGGNIWVCKNPCHDLITKPVELILGVCRSTSNGTTIHIRLPLDGVPIGQK